MRNYLVLLLPCLTLNLKSPPSPEFGKGDILTRSSSQDDSTAELSQKRRANVMEGGRDPANVILRQRRLKVRRTGKRSGEPGEDEKPKLPAAHAAEVKRKKTNNRRFNYSMDKRGDMRWESLRMYSPSPILPK